MADNIKNTNNILHNHRGSAAIILSLMVSGGTLSTVYMTQKMAGNFFNRMSQTMEEWETNLVVRSVQTLAGYLVSNNLILCREQGWQGTPSKKCKWREDGDKKPADFKLSKPQYLNEGLSFQGIHNLEGIDKHYKVIFNLVDWRDTAIQSFIGEIPEYICRRKEDLRIIEDATCPNYSSVGDPTNQPCNNKPGSVCEYIKPVDGDHWIVLVKVELPFTDPVSGVKKTHTALSGIRRPLAMFVLQSIAPGKQCSLACNVGRSANFAPDCKGRLFPSEEGVYGGLASSVLTVKNEGPGAIYKLSLVKYTTNLDNINEKIMDVTPDIIASAKKEVLLPGDTLSFESFYKCPVEVRTEVIRRSGTRDSVSSSVSNEMVPVRQVEYAFSFDAQNPAGACYSSAGDTFSSVVKGVDVTLPANRGLISSAVCRNGASSCSHGGQTGTCEYANIEPKRMFLSVYPSPIGKEHRMVVERSTTVTVTPPPPSPRRSATGGVSFACGCGGGGGGSN